MHNETSKRKIPPVPEITSSKDLIAYLDSSERLNKRKYLYHYTTIRNAIAIFKSGTWHLGNPRDMNDVVEYPVIVQKKLIKKRSAFQRGHGLQLRNKRGNRIFQACVKCCAICFGNEPRNDGICQNTANTGQQKSDCKYFCK